MTARPVELLIVGAGPYGLAMAAYCREAEIEHLLLGEAMAFWRCAMPRGMRLRSRRDWHLDPFEEDTLDRYIERAGDPLAEHDPIPLGTYLAYAEWFMARKGISTDGRLVKRLTLAERPGDGFTARLDDGAMVAARNVMIAAGFGASAIVPEALAAAPRARHAQDAADIARLKRRRCLIVGGRQSAFEWAALACEAGAAEVHLVHRHPTPRFGPADWSWVAPLLDLMLGDPGWYRRLPAEAKKRLLQHMWKIGRGQLEPWLAPALAAPQLRLWPHANVAAWRERGDGVAVRIDGGPEVTVDEIILATGYRTDVQRLAFLGPEVASRLAVTEGYPCLDEAFQSSLPGLYFANRFASRDFGHFFDFTAGVRVAAQLIGRSVLARRHGADAAPRRRVAAS